MQNGVPVRLRFKRCGLDVGKEYVAVGYRGGLLQILVDGVMAPLVVDVQAFEPIAEESLRNLMLLEVG